MNMLQVKKAILVLLMIAGIASCKKVFDVQPGTELDESRMYRNVYDANAAVMGVYSKFMAISDRYIILNELRADLLAYTQNADEYLRQISAHAVKDDNPYASPRPFYEVILNCNDVLNNLAIMRQKNSLTEAEYNMRYSDVAALRCFLYLQLGVHYGEVPYITEALENVADVNDPTRFRKLSLDKLIDTLISVAEGLPFKEIYPPNVSNGVSTSLNFVLDTYSTQLFFINKKCLLGDLHLWKGNYTQAATYYRQIMETATPDPNNENRFALYKIGSSDVNLYVTYSRAGDASTLLWNNGWRTIFDQGSENSDRRVNRELIWLLPYDSKFKPENPLINLFSPVGGNYLVKPSKWIIDAWAAQQQWPVANAGSGSGIPYDGRGLFSVQQIAGQPVAMKFLYNYINYATGTPVNPFAKNGRWYLYRQTHLHLRFAEAANRDRFHRLAYALFNNGIRNNFPAPANTPDVTNYHNTLNYPDPYKFDARQGEIPFYRAPWYRNIGVRSRANLTNYPIVAGADSLMNIEEGLINEGALENAFEGTRWPDLVRVAMRRNDPAFLADKIYAKLLSEGDPNATAVRTKLMNKENWFLPFKW